MYKTCAIIGATPDEFEWGYDEEYMGAYDVKTKIAVSIYNSLLVGCTEFITSFYQGVEMWAAEAIAKMREGGSKIELTGVPDGDEQSNRWHPDIRDRYFNLIDACSSILDTDPVAYIASYAELIIVIGENPGKHAAAIIEKARENGAKIVHIK